MYTVAKQRQQCMAFHFWKRLYGYDITCKWSGYLNGIKCDFFPEVYNLTTIQLKP